MRDEPAVKAQLVRDHGLSVDEYERILSLLRREPTFTELGIFSAMWNEHCSYKSSRRWLRRLPSTGPQVVCGPGENAGVVDIGDGQVVVFKMESHNHPSYIEPYQGAATGVGGILRDVFTMGARPVAAMNSLSFGSPDHPKTRALMSGVVEGIGGYGNCFGVPTVGGELRFHEAYNGNCLVNAFAAGLADADSVFYSAASGVGMPVVYLGARTGRDGVGGASMASTEFDGEVGEMRPTVQVGDPFTEKRLMEACLELMRTGAVIAIQDMGAAGLTCSAVEMGDKGDLGIHIELGKVPVREEGMTAYEMMLSESQERMLMVLRPDLEGAARAVFRKWDLEFAVIGKTIEEDRFLVTMDGNVKADLPLKALSGLAPEYDRPWTRTPPAPSPEPAIDIDPIEGLSILVSSLNHASREWVYRQYDHSVMADTVRPPGRGAAVVRVHGRRKALAFTSDSTPRYCRANPFEGGKQAVAEACRNLVAAGAKPLACTDCLNFGNPEKPDMMGQFVECIEGIAEACKALEIPIVSGNVSLYNETSGEAVLPTPTIGAVGLVDDLRDLIDGAPSEGDVLILVGETRGHLGQSAILAEAFGREEGDAPPVDLESERAHGAFVLACRAFVSAATDLSDGGLALAAFEVAEAAGFGVTVDAGDCGWYFGEDQARYLLVASRDNAALILDRADGCGIPARAVGFIGGTRIRLGGVSAEIGDLSRMFRSSLGAFADDRIRAPGLED